MPVLFPRTCSPLQVHWRQAFWPAPLIEDVGPVWPCKILTRWNRLGGEVNTKGTNTVLWQNYSLVVNKNGEREQTRDGVWKSRSNRLQCIFSRCVRRFGTESRVMSYINVVKIAIEEQKDVRTRTKSQQDIFARQRTCWTTLQLHPSQRNSASQVVSAVRYTTGVMAISSLVLQTMQISDWFW